MELQRMVNVLLAGRELVSFLVHRALDDVPEASHRGFFLLREFFGEFADVMYWSQRKWLILTSYYL